MPDLRRTACGVISSALLALGVLGCGSSSKSSVKHVTPVAAHVWKPGERATIHTNVCTVAARRVIAQRAGVAVGAVAMRRSIAPTYAPQCTFRAGRLALWVSVNGAPQAYAVMMRQVEETAQFWGPKRWVAAPVMISSKGGGTYWFPNTHQVLTTEGVNLVTVDIMRWQAVPHHRWVGLGTEVAHRYLGRTQTSLMVDEK